MAGDARAKVVVVYADAEGNEPFTQWLRELKDRRDRKRIETRLLRLQQGNYGDCKSVGGGICELRMFFGPGYRVYFGEDGDTLVVLLSGGDKSSRAKISNEHRRTGRIISAMRKYRTFDEVTTEYYRVHPEEIDDFLKVTFEEYAQDNDIGALLSALRIISRLTSSPA